MIHSSKKITFVACSVLCFVFGLMSCVIVKGPQVKRMSGLEALNGENYNTPKTAAVNPVAVTFVERKQRSTTISGRLVRQESLVDVPMKNARLKIKNESGAVLEEVRTQLNGQFSFVGVYSKGRYQLELVHELYSAQLQVEVLSYTIENLLMIAVAIK